MTLILPGLKPIDVSNVNSLLLIDSCLNDLPLFENVAVVSEEYQDGTGWLQSPQEIDVSRKSNHPEVVSFTYPEAPFFL